MALSRVLLIQPPLIQLNGPYPAPYYLKSFLEKQGMACQVRDHSLGLFERVFCPPALKRIFADARLRYEAGSSGSDIWDDRERCYIERFLSEEDRWIASIEGLVLFLRGKNREWGHFLGLANGVPPSGPRFDAAIESLGSQASPDNANLLGAKLLEDLADFITVTVDPSFRLIRYDSSITPGNVSWKPPEGYIIQNFYRPYLKEEWDALDETVNQAVPLNQAVPVILGLTIPFPGCLPGALVCAQSAKERFGGAVIVIAGGGYVNTELRSLDTVPPGSASASGAPESSAPLGAVLFDYFDYLAFDRGYGSLKAILNYLSDAGKTNEPGLYKTMYRSVRDGRIIKGPGIDGDAAPDVESGADPELRGLELRDLEKESVRTVFPDYRGVDFSRYLYLVDDQNPMHRLWSDGHWLKAYLAHGCYWHACAFCDTTLDYIHGFEPVDCQAFFKHLKAQAEQTGIRAVHLVDEAAPVQSLIRLAELNRASGLPLIFWGNIRFEGAFSPDVAALLAAGGLIGISAGIEVASPQGFKRLGKGIGLREVVRACAAFKEQGILTHAYLIYGYWDESPQELIDSAETLRQLFAAGLLDSAFWHKFVLTSHSRIYVEWKRGKHRDLKVLPRVLPDRASSPDALPFARNDLHFAGEARFDKYTEPLDRLLAAWMAGDHANPVAWAFPFRVPQSQVPPDLASSLLDEYARNRDRDRSALPNETDGAGMGGIEGTGERLLFLGSRPFLSRAGKGIRLRWRWRMEDHTLELNESGDGSVLPGRREILAALIERARHESPAAQEFYAQLEQILGAEVPQAWQVLRNGGLIRY